MTTTQSTTLTAAQWLQDRRMLLLHTDEVQHIPDALRSVGGLVLTGAEAAHVGRQLRLHSPGLPLLVQVESPTRGFATPSDPYLFGCDNELFPIDLANYVKAQLDCGNEYVLSPTGFLPSHDRAALRAVLTTSNAVESDRLIVTLPIDASWLRPNRVRQLAAVVQRCKHPVAIALGSDSKPLDTDTAGGLLYLLAMSPTISVLFADHLVGCEVAARSRGMVAVGLVPSRRRVTPPGEQPKSFRSERRRPHVLHEPLHRVLGPKTVDDWWANSTAPACGSCCTNVSLADYTNSSADLAAALLHNAASTLRMLASVSVGSTTDRVLALADRYERAELEHERVSLQLKRRIRPEPAQQVLARKALGQRATIARTAAQQTATAVPNAVAPQTAPQAAPAQRPPR